MDPAEVSRLFRAHGVHDPWHALPATGVANLIYATGDIVLRIATDHPDGVVDARTESVAAPVAFAAGIRTPRMIAFDESGSLIDRPYSLWERVHGETLGLLALDPGGLLATWREVGRELARLHDRVRVCPDPLGYLDTPGRPSDLSPLLERLRIAGLVAEGEAGAIGSLLDELCSAVGEATPVRFIHHDIHPMNLMCTATGSLLAIIDWGDAGWGDPALDFAAIPLAFLDASREGYESEAPGALGDRPEARFLWDKLHYAMEGLSEGRSPKPYIDAIREVLGRGGERL